MIKAHLIPIVNELFDVASRLREIDSNYVVYFNKLTNGCEVHNHSQKVESLALTLPYDRLDARAVTLARQTRVENAQRLFEEMERANANAEKKAVDRALDRCVKEMKL